MKGYEAFAQKYPEPSNTLTRYLRLKALTQRRFYGNGSRRLVTGYTSLFAIPSAKAWPARYLLVDSGLDPNASLIKSSLEQGGATIDDGIDGVVFTHAHEDHVRGSKSLIGRDIPFFIAHEGIARLKGQQKSQGFLPHAKDACRSLTGRGPAAELSEIAAQSVHDGQEIQIGDLEATVIGVPGHTDDSIALVVNSPFRDGAHIYVGDSLDFSKGDKVKAAFRPVSHDHSQAVRSIIRLVTTVESMGIPIAEGEAVHPAHSGSGQWTSVLDYAYRNA